MFLFRLGFGSVGTSVEVAWKESSVRSSGRSILLGIMFASSGRSVAVGIMFAGEMRWLLSMCLPARCPLEPTTSVLIDDELVAVDCEAL